MDGRAEQGCSFPTSLLRSSSNPKVASSNLAGRASKTPAHRYSPTSWLGLRRARTAIHTARCAYV
ncbi:MAG TPA: hypothetical protein VFX61_00040, partial [Micromonosporaceae bacterium]|nr:hypothetical protein [Micromonosporaceae bacterium]